MATLTFDLTSQIDQFNSSRGCLMTIEEDLLRQAGEITEYQQDLVTNHYYILWRMKVPIQFMVYNSEAKE